jgi:FkbM family methyltransferase
MNKRGLVLLGRIAFWFRKAGLRPVFTVVRDVVDAFFRAAHYPPLAAAVDGVRLHGFLRHRSYLEHLARGTYEPASWRFFRELIPSAHVFVDAGAHIGLYSVLSGRFGAPGLVIFAFEPDPYNLLAFRWNVRRSRCKDVTVFQAAVSDTAGSAEFLVSDGTIGSSLVLGRTEIGTTHVKEVETVALDPLLEGFASKTVLAKLDIEGAEIRALKGLADTLRRAERIAVLCEVNPEALRAGGKTPSDLIAALRDAGLQVFFISEETGGLMPVKESCETKGNLLAMRNWMIPKDWILA